MKIIPLCPQIGSIAEREHMKWKNAVDFPNNPYSPEALQRRLSQTSSHKLLDIDDFKNKMNVPRPESPQQMTEPMTVTLSESKLNPPRFVSQPNETKPNQIKNKRK